MLVPPLPGNIEHSTVTRLDSSTMSRIDLISLSHSAAHPDWTLGAVSVVTPLTGAVADALANTQGDAVLCLDGRLPLPDAALLTSLLEGPADAWHGGLRLGSGNQFPVLDHVQPQWMLTAPTTPDAVVTSPLLSLRAMLVRRAVLDQLGGPDRGFASLTGAGIDLGIGWTKAGAIVRHVPELVPPSTPAQAGQPIEDEFRTLTRRFGRVWAFWALGRSVTQRRVGLRASTTAARTIRRTVPTSSAHYSAPGRKPGTTDRSVSVILPTVDRYRYLETVLHQLAGQTQPPHQVIVVDQTPPSKRSDQLASIAPALPLLVRTQDTPGQCTARNTALDLATGEFVLFIDDDDEIEADLIERHLLLLGEGIDAICGGVNDATAGPPPPGFRHRRASDVFPTNNTMLRRSALARSGLFDPVYDKGSRADHDLGMRLHLSGAVLVYDPSVLVFHHHAPAGGLRTHGARAVTRAGSRRTLLVRNLPSLTESYLSQRYFTPRQQRESTAIHLFSLLSGDGAPWRRLARAGAQVVLLPSSIRQIRSTTSAASTVLADRPAIPELAGGDPL